MRKNITRWKPDTCGCIIDFELMGEEHKLDKVIKKCSEHTDVTDEVLFKVLLEENRSKNIFLKEVLERHKELDVNGILRKDVNFSWEFTGQGENRKFVPNLTGNHSLTKSEISDILSSNPILRKRGSETK